MSAPNGPTAQVVSDTDSAGAAASYALHLFKESGKIIRFLRSVHLGRKACSVPARKYR